eukprot:CAMPEP_0113934556 /NCGR_PEP_ID=MMETSP1339-20121228/1881_1 /TAXON_ID=94617 /ORGANISM="Fibrocapsa japonica" /LENGTH=232 /DNA_ID=CAMNT_0000936413 /DNA_START=59 /DNA_END=757 /DNA_ORIENTATION=- /assembly_acc=CAM_ASM_000762
MFWKATFALAVATAAVVLGQDPNPCGCSDVEFCNFDSGDTGFCEACSNFQSSLACDMDGLPERGAQDCKDRCFGGSCTDSFGDFCGGSGSDGVCYCSEDCHAWGDCCEDVCDVCGYCGDCVDDPEAILAAEGNTCSTKFGLNGAPTPVCDIFDGDYNGFMRFVWQLCPSSCGRCNDPDQYIVPDMCQDDEDCDDGEECRSPDWGTSCGNVQRLRKLNFGNTKGGCLFCLPML